MIDSNLAPDDFLKWRRRMQWTREYAGKKLGISYSSVQNYETGKRADTYDCTVPLVVCLAMTALEAGLKPLCGYPKKDKTCG